MSTKLFKIEIHFFAVERLESIKNSETPGMAALSCLKVLQVEKNFWDFQNFGFSIWDFTFYFWEIFKNHYMRKAMPNR